MVGDGPLVAPHEAGQTGFGVWRIPDKYDQIGSAIWS